MVTSITLVALLYVHQQVELVKLSYAIEYKEKKLKDMLDHNEGLGYNIDNLEAPSRLEQVLLSKRVDITFPKQRNVVRASNLPYGRNENSFRPIGVAKKPDIFGIFDFFSSAAEAQAKEQ